MSSNCTSNHWDYRLEREQAAWYQRFEKIGYLQGSRAPPVFATYWYHACMNILGSPAQNAEFGAKRRSLPYLMVVGRVVNRKLKVFFFGRFFSVFPHRKPTFESRFFGFPNKPTLKNRFVFFRSFFSPVPYANNAYTSVFKPRHVWTVLLPPQTSAHSTAARHRYNVLYIPGTGIGIMVSYPQRGLYRIKHGHFYIGISMASYPLPGLYRISIYHFLYRN